MSDPKETTGCDCRQPGLGGDCDGSCTHPPPLTREWMIEHFGDPYPAQVIDFLFERAADFHTLGKVREAIRHTGEMRKRGREAGT